MKINKKLIFYFGFGGVLPVMYFTGEGIYTGRYDPTVPGFYGNILQNLLVSYTMTTLVSLLVLICLEQVDKIFPWEKSIWKRFFADVFITPIIAAIGVYPLANVTYFIFDEYDPFEIYIIKNEIIAVVLDLILVAIYEGSYFFKKWKQSLLKTERLEKENIASKFEALKNQINPHFLFNSLNTLSSLVHEDADKSEAFIDEFAKIYRYVLENQDNIVVPLKKEVNFIHSYMYLQKIRFGDNIDLDIDINEQKLDDMVPTLSLQLLIENAIKHNKVTKSDPLKMKIFSNGEFLHVENNLQPRESNQNSTGIGLKNLKERYELTSDKQPQFSVVNSSYVAKIPLISAS